jgi:hypothetical protein
MIALLQLIVPDNVDDFFYAGEIFKPVCHYDPGHTESDCP